MNWKFEHHEHETFQRNPLVAVITQLQFDPVLKVGTFVPEVQDRLRHRFPRFEKRKVEVLEVSPRGPRVQSVTEYVLRARNEPTTVVLGARAVSIEYADHKQRETLLEDAALVYGTAAELLAPTPTRLGLRYVNVIDRDKIGESLDEELTWEDLVNVSFLQPAQNFADLDGTKFSVEVSSPCETGSMTLRYGLLPKDQNTAICSFRLDIDRYRDDNFDVDDIQGALTKFADDIYTLFREVAAEGLERWMRHD